MDYNIAIDFQHVGKQYRLGRVGTGTLSHDLNRWWQTTVLGKEDPYLKIGETNDRTTKGHSDYVWALQDITFINHETINQDCGIDRCRVVRVQPGR